MTSSLLPFLVFGMPGGSEMIVILVIGLLLFGGRLPEVARNIGKGIQEFKRGLSDLDREVAQPMRNAMRLDPDDEPVPYEPPRLPSTSVERGSRIDDSTTAEVEASVEAAPVESTSAEPQPADSLASELSSSELPPSDLRDRAEDESRLAQDA